MASNHVMQCVELDDGGSRRCLGCNQYVHGNLTEVPPGQCPTPYVEPKVRIAHLEAERTEILNHIKCALDLLEPVRRGANINPAEIWQAVDHLETGYRR